MFSLLLLTGALFSGALWWALGPLNLGRALLLCALSFAFLSYPSFLIYSARGSETLLNEALVFIWAGLFGWAFFFAGLSAIALFVWAALKLSDAQKAAGLIFSGRSFAVLLIFSALLGGAALLNALKTPQTDRVTIALEGLPAAFDGYRITQITDTHFGLLFGKERAEKIVQIANSLHSDAIALTGDYADGLLADRRAETDILFNLRAKDGVFAVEGNHEHYYDYERWMAYWKSAPLVFLQNRSVLVTREGAFIAFAGTADIGASRFPGHTPSDIGKALSDVPEGVPVILLTHQVRRAEENAARGVSLQLSGHTHGGQVLLFDLVVKALNKGFVRGLYDVSGMALYVGNGADLWAGFPLRLGAPAQITQITLKRKKP